MARSDYIIRELVSGWPVIGRLDHGNFLMMCVVRMALIGLKVMMVHDTVLRAAILLLKILL